MRIKLPVALIAVIVMLSGCRFGFPNEGSRSPGDKIEQTPKVVLNSSTKTEFLFEQKSPIPYNKQWVYGNWRHIRMIDEMEAEEQIARERIEFKFCCSKPDNKPIWIFDCNGTYDWKNPPPCNDFRDIKRKDGKIFKERFQQVSIYRDFFGSKNLADGTLYVMAAGDVDIYMDPPAGTPLVNNPALASKYYLGHADSLKQTAFNIFKIYPGTHCLYFVHSSKPGHKFFGLKYWLETSDKPGQISDCQWPVKENNCQCGVSNGNTETLDSDNDWNNKGDTRYPNGSTPVGTPLGGEWVYSSWSPAKVINYDQADKVWGGAVGGTPWINQYDKGACWITHEPHRITNDRIFGKELTWRKLPTGYTSIYRHTFTVDKDSQASLYIYTNDIVDVFLDPADPDPISWFSFTRIQWQGRTPLPMNNSWLNQPSYYYIGRADKQARGMKIDLENLIPAGTHTLYFVHRNSSETYPVPSSDYYGMLFSLCVKSDCGCLGDNPEKK